MWQAPPCSQGSILPGLFHDDVVPYHQSTGTMFVQSCKAINRVSAQLPTPAPRRMRPSERTPTGWTCRAIGTAVLNQRVGPLHHRYRCHGSTDRTRQRVLGHHQVIVLPDAVGVTRSYDGSSTVSRTRARTRTCSYTLEFTVASILANVVVPTVGPRHTQTRHS